MSVAPHERLIVSAASASYGPSLVALLGSLNLNWPGHPPVLVYDLGLDAATRTALHAAGIALRRVPPFVPHWRRHFTWKIWCLNDAPARGVLWLDAGLVVLAPLDEVFAAIERQGYFLVPNFQLLDREASEAACRGCGVASEFRLGKPTLAGGLMGFAREGQSGRLLEEALAVARVEAHLAATEPGHRHDQAVLSLLMYREFGTVTTADGEVYLGWRAPDQVAGQKVWVHRGGLAKEDRDHFARHLATPGAPYRPAPPSAPPPLRRVRALIGRMAGRIAAAVGPRRRPAAQAAIYDGVRD